jgi:putative tryptophan/tyrosine transport system substrate-binding protein
VVHRREFLAAASALGASALATPFGSLAQQQGKVWRVGFLSPRSRPSSLNSHFYSAFIQGMRDLGYLEGKNLVIEWRFADSKLERLPALIAELVQLKVDVIVTVGTPAVRAVQKATTAIPVVMASVTNPLESGLVKNLARPGGNTTGLSTMTADISPKLLEMLQSVVAKLSLVVVMVNPDNSSTGSMLKNIEAAARGTGVTILTVEARAPQEIENAFTQMVRQNARALIVTRDTFFNEQVRQIAELAAKHRLPSIAGIREYVEAGGLMSYGANVVDLYRHAATYVDKIFKGAKPGDLPVEQPTKIEFFINRKTAMALDITIPQSILVRADRVIE